MTLSVERLDLAAGTACVIGKARKERLVLLGAVLRREFGVDAGVRSLALLSTGERIPNPRPLWHALRKIARLNRELARRPVGSRNREETRRRLAREHARVARIRQDAMHKLTHRLATTYGTVVVERLHGAGMVRNRRLSRALCDAGLAELRRQLAYKCVWYGGRLVEADTFYPSSKTCFRCGAVKATLPLSERVYRCDACAVALDRDENAALNLAALAAHHVAKSGLETQNARQRNVRPSLAGQTRMTREAGIGAPIPDKTDTPDPQGSAA